MLGGGSPGSRLCAARDPHACLGPTRCGTGGTAHAPPLSDPTARHATTGRVLVPAVTASLRGGWSCRGIVEASHPMPMNSTPAAAPGRTATMQRAERRFWCMILCMLPPQGRRADERGSPMSSMPLRRPRAHAPWACDGEHLAAHAVCVYITAVRVPPNAPPHALPMPQCTHIPAVWVHGVGIELQERTHA